MIEFEEDTADIGRLGETQLTKWCDSIGLTSNESLHKDKMGWDHLIEFPYIKSDKPKDKQPSPIECKIQVKSTFNKKGGVQIKLSTLKRLVDYTSPAFILFYEFENPKHPILINAYLVHIDELLITEILKLTREEEVKETLRPLHKIKLWVKYTKKHKLEPKDAKTLRDRIVNFVPNGMAEYQKNKNALKKDVGYGKDGFILQFNTSPEEMNQHFLEAALGMPSKIEVKNTVLKDNRFNCPIIEDKSETAQLEVSVNIIDECRLDFKTDKYSPPISFTGQYLTVPQLFEKNSVYFRTTLFTLKLSEDNKLTLHLTTEKQASLDELLRFFTIFSKKNRQTKLFINIKFQNKKENLNLRMLINEEFKDTSNLVSSLKYLKNKFDIDGNSLNTLDALYDNQDTFIFLFNVFKNKIDEIRYTLDNEKSKVVSLHTLAIQIGDVHIGMVAIFHGKKISGSNYQAYKVEVVKAITIQDTPTTELLDEIQNTALQSRIELDNTNET